MRRASGFTLVELLIVIITIALLASLSITAVFRAQNSAKQAKTKVLITKLHELLSGHMSTYSNRRLPIDVSGYDPDLAAEFKLQALRQLMRLELPDSWQDVYAGRVNINLSDSSVVSAGNLYLPAVASAYQSYRESINTKLGSYPSANFQSSECLYMIVTIGLSDRTEGLKIFSDDQVADVDNDGANEFVDAWGVPISFIRWPVGFVDDPRHDAETDQDHPFGHLSDLQPSKLAEGVTEGVECRCDQRIHHDPHDPRGVDPFAYFVFPLIYSAGPDKQWDIFPGDDPKALDEIDDPFAEVCTANENGTFGVADRWVLSAAQDTSSSVECAAYDPTADTALLTGVPKDRIIWSFGPDGKSSSSTAADGELNHYDNIHNHMLTTKIGE